MHFLGNGKKYCGEHSTADEIEDSRIACPLDPKHTVDRNKLERHLLRCNSKPIDEQPAYIKPGCNILDSETPEDDTTFRLSEVPKAELDSVIQLVEDLFDEMVAGKIEMNVREHKVLDEELANAEYGNEKRKHLLQTSSILGIMQEKDFLKANTYFIEYGAGKAALTFWLATAVQDLKNAKVLVVDRASHRHKKDNQIKDRDLVERIRADIADLDLQGLDTLSKCESIVGVSKHLCGAATDLSLRCMVLGNQNGAKSTGFIICVCCHHRCSWNTFVGRDWLIAHGIDKKTFNLIIKMVSWCVCGDGYNRDRVKTLEKESVRKEKEEIGWKCKRVLDHARAHYMSENNYDVKLSFYAEKSVTLENVCITGSLRN